MGETLIPQRQPINRKSGCKHERVFEDIWLNFQQSREPYLRIDVWRSATIHASYSQNMRQTTDALGLEDCFIFIVPRREKFSQKRVDLYRDENS